MIASDDFQEIKNSLIDRLVFGLALVSGVALLGSLARVFEIGFQPVMVFHVALVLGFISVNTFRERLSSNFKAWFIVGALFFAGIAGLVNFGLDGNGVLILYTTAVIACLTIHTKAGITFAILGGVLQVLCYLGIFMGWLSFSFDMDPYAHSLPAWLNSLSTYAILLSMTIFLVDRVFVYMAGMSIALQAQVELQTQQLDQSNTILTAVLESLPFGVFWKDRGLRLTGSNQQFADEVGADSPAAIEGKTDYQLTTTEKAQRYQQEDLEILQTGLAKRNMVEKVAEDASQDRYIMINKVPLRNNSDEIVGILGTYSDITETKKLELALRDAKEQAEHASQAKSSFLANMSHEIRTPINGVMGLLELSLGTELTKQQRDYLTRAEQSAHTLLSIINQILDISKIEAGKMDIEHVPFELADILQIVQNHLNHVATSKGIAFVVDTKGKVDGHLLGDPTKLQQILINLSSNAIKFTEQGKVHLTIGGLPKDGRLQLRITVQDTGIGISEDNQRKLFDTFTQADSSTTRRFGGTGLGLSIVKQLLELQGGSIQLQSEEGVGTTFTCFIGYDMTDERELSVRDTAATHLNDVKVLLVEDNEVNQMIAKEMLLQSGAKVIVAGDGLIALKALEAYHFDIVLMDIQMPNMDGTQAIKELRKREHLQHLPVVAMTANVLSHEVKEYAAMGFNRHLGKPFQRQELIEMVSGCLREQEQNPV